jgi:hypothetical protein
MGPTLSPETSAFKLQTPGKFPEEYKLQNLLYLHMHLIIKHTAKLKKIVTKTQTTKPNSVNRSGNNKQNP